jgi:hypothetical protein
MHKEVISKSQTTQEDPITLDGESVTIRVWYDVGNGWMINTEALDIDHPEHVYNQILAQGKIPEDYGYVHPYAEEYDAKSRNELIHEIVSLRKEIISLHKSGWF